MRPTILFPLFADVSSLKGVGANAVKALIRLLGPGSVGPFGELSAGKPPLIRDVLFHKPSNVIDRRTVYSLAEAPHDQVVTLLVRVDSHKASSPARSRRPYKVTVEDDTGSAVLTFFNGKNDYLQTVLPVGQKRVISGKLELYDGILQMTHPDIIAREDELAQVAKLDPQYPMVSGLYMKNFHKWVVEALTRIPTLNEWIRDDYLAKHQWMGWKEAVCALHAPENSEDLEATSPVRSRLAYDELLAHQLALALMRSRLKHEPGAIISAHSELQQTVRHKLPFALTDGQEQVLSEIEKDMASAQRMMRLLQGDVGSGKTVVALLAMLNVVAQGGQTALMAPTEILARQHVASLKNLLVGSEIQVALLTGKASASEKKAMQAAIASGTIDIVVGTHALFQGAVQFKKLGMVVVDEQHRFGVNQRVALSEKGDNPHILLMTATPIPRTLTMTAYGDMASSILKEKPQGRLDIDTRAIPLQRIDEVVAGLRRVLERGDRIYWICPLIEEKEPSTLGYDYAGDLAAAEERHRVLKQVFGERVGLVHGQMKVNERESAMRSFANAETDILVATTVVEVGVDVPEATVMIIEHAERFGLAQLHQLRGRVGRNDKQSSCILLYAEHISEIAQKRLKIIRESNDGFYIAEEDLMLRGAGEVLGTKQSGMPDFHFVDLLRHGDLLRAAYDDVRLTLQQDPQLISARGEALQTLLALFDYDIHGLQQAAA